MLLHMMVEYKARKKRREISWSMLVKVKAAEILNIGWGDQSEDIFQNSKIMKSCERLYVCVYSRVQKST